MCLRCTSLISMSLVTAASHRLFNKRLAAVAKLRSAPASPPKLMDDTWKQSEQQVVNLLALHLTGVRSNWDPISLSQM